MSLWGCEICFNKPMKPTLCFLMCASLFCCWSPFSFNVDRGERAVLPCFQLTKGLPLSLKTSTKRICPTTQSGNQQKGKRQGDQIHCHSNPAGRRAPCRTLLLIDNIIAIILLACLLMCKKTNSSMTTDLEKYSKHTHTHTHAPKSTRPPSSSCKFCRGRNQTARRASDAGRSSSLDCLIWSWGYFLKVPFRVIRTSFLVYNKPAKGVVIFHTLSLLEQTTRDALSVKNPPSL